MKENLTNRIFSLILVIMAVSCSHDDFSGRNQWDGLSVRETIRVDGNINEYETGNHLIDSVSYVILEYLDDYPVGEINTLLFMDDYIVVADQRAADAVYLFDYNGKFRRQISSQGTGPGEYVNLTYVTLSADKREIVIQDRARGNMMWFDINGRLTRTKVIPSYSGNIEFLSESTWITDIYPCNKNVTRRGHNPFFIVTDSAWNYRYALNYSRKFREPYRVVPRPVVKTYEGTVNGSIPDDRRIYCFTEDSVYVRYRFLIDRESDEYDWDRLYNEYHTPESDDFVRLLHPILECPGYVSFSVRNAEGTTRLVYHKQEGKVYRFETYSHDDFIYNFLDRTIFCRDNILISSVGASNFYSAAPLISREASPIIHEIAGKVNAESNPVLIFYHLKQ